MFRNFWLKGYSIEVSFHLFIYYVELLAEKILPAYLFTLFRLVL